jgi:hypothetical protein
MIFCETPWRNEPGTGIASGPGAERKSREYNLRRQPMTVAFGMLAWLKRLKREDGIWNDVVMAHFKLNEDKIMDKLEEWAKSNHEIEKWGHWAGTGSDKIKGIHLGTTDLYKNMQDELKLLGKGLTGGKGG